MLSPKPALVDSGTSEDECGCCGRSGLRETTRPTTLGSAGGTPGPALEIVDLFAGCGGFSLGVAAAAGALGLEATVTLAVEYDSVPAAVFQSNHPGSRVSVAQVQDIFDGPLGSRPTSNEREAMRQVGSPTLLIAGPPCQGHSNLNNVTRRADPRNELYGRVARAAEILLPQAVLIENVPSVSNDRGGIVHRTRAALERAGYDVATRVLDMATIGVPQRRQRHLLLAGLAGLIEPSGVLEAVSQSPARCHAPTVRWAIGDLAQPNGDTGGLIFDSPSTPTAENQRRMDWLVEHEAMDLPNYLRPACHQQPNHSYNSMYGRLHWDRPAQTITTGFGSMGQGRFVHPAYPRTLTPHEAARLQTFPDWFTFESVVTRKALATMIANAVPPAAAEVISGVLFEQLALETGPQAGVAA